RAQDAERAAAEAKARAGQEAATAVQRERERLAAEQARARAEAEARARDQAHRAQVNREVLADLCDLDLGGWRLEEGPARILIAAIARGRVAHVAIRY
ncbi:hypothetical protein CKO41_14125, partial [Thiococcus pfennigii]|nr:hypothetical protein [Thiococcus pfennigii]